MKKKLGCTLSAYCDRCNASLAPGQKRLTQVAIAKGANLSTTTINQLWNGRAVRIELETMFKLMQFLNCTPNDLFAVVDDTSDPDFLRERQALIDKRIYSQ